MTTTIHSPITMDIFTLSRFYNLGAIELISMFTPYLVMFFPFMMTFRTFSFNNIHVITIRMVMITDSTPMHYKSFNHFIFPQIMINKYGMMPYLCLAAKNNVIRIAKIVFIHFFLIIIFIRIVHFVFDK
eukprot:UN04928